jgi:1,4-alpha-glucan branching enzyme
MITKTYLKAKARCQVTFELSPAELPEGVQAKQIALVGDFNDWDPTATPMQRLENGVFATTLELEPGQTYQFRYLINNMYWYNDWTADAYVESGYGEENFIVQTPAGACS